MDLEADATLLAVNNIIHELCIEIKETPGPGSYKIPSVFDKFKRLPPKEYYSITKGSRGASPEQNDLKAEMGLDEADL